MQPVSLGIHVDLDMKTGIRLNLSKLTRWLARSMLIGTVSVLLLSAFVSTDLAADRRIRAQALSALEILDAEQRLFSIRLLDRTGQWAFRQRLPEWSLFP